MAKRAPTQPVDPKWWSLGDARGVMSLAAAFAVLVYLLPELDGPTFDERDARRRAWMAGAVPAFAASVWMMASTARADGFSRAAGLVVLGVSAATLIETGHGAYAAAFLPLAGLFASPLAPPADHLGRSTVAFSVVALANLLSPWLVDLGLNLGVDDPTRTVLSVGTLSAVGVASLSGHISGWRATVAAGFAIVLSLLTWLSLEWRVSGTGLAGVAILFALPALAITWADADDKLSWRDRA